MCYGILRAHLRHYDHRDRHGHHDLRGHDGRDRQASLEQLN